MMRRYQKVVKDFIVHLVTCPDPQCHVKRVFRKHLPKEASDAL